MTWFWQALAYFLAAVAGHAVYSRLRFGGNSVLKFFLSGGLAGLELMRRQAWEGGVAPESLAAVLCYAFLCELYLFCFTFVRSSVSMSILFALRQQELSEAEIDRLYSDASMVERRTQKLVREGCLSRGRSGYVLTAKGRIVVFFFRKLQAFFRHGF